jgi:hypothetical protein
LPISVATDWQSGTATFTNHNSHSWILQQHVVYGSRIAQTGICGSILSSFLAELELADDSRCPFRPFITYRRFISSWWIIACATDTFTYKPVFPAIVGRR